MANSTTLTGQTMQITGLDANWNIASDTNWTQMKIKSILFEPSGANDEMIIRSTSASGAKLFHATATDTNDQKIKYFFGGRVSKPVITIAQCTLSSAAAATVLIDFE